MKLKNITAITCVCFSLFLFHASLSNAQSWQWGEAGRGSLKTNDYSSPVATDKDGNAYLTGQFSNSITFGSVTLTGNYENAFLLKYNSAGTVVWAAKANDSGSSSSFGTAVATDLSGNVFITGPFYDTVGFGSFSLKTKHQTIMLVKYSASGNVVWAKQSVNSSPNGYGTSYAIATDKFKNVFVTGYFYDTVSFGVYTLTSPRSQNVFLAKYDSSGNILWAKESVIPSTFSTGIAYSVTTDNAGNAYLTGEFEDTISFGSTRLISNKNYSVFIAKYSPAGNVIWAKQSVNGTVSSFAIGFSIASDEAKSLYTTGYFSSKVSFGSKTLNVTSNSSIFLTKYDSGGNALWAIRSDSGWEGTSVSCDRMNHVYLGGSGNGNYNQVKFGSYVLSCNPAAVDAGFIIRFDTAGNAVCGSMLNNLGSNSGKVGTASDSSGTYVYTSGTFNDTVICGPDTLIPTSGGVTVFVGRWNNCSTGLGIEQVTSSNASVTLFPNPNTGAFTLRVESEKLKVKSGVAEVYNMLGENVYSSPFTIYNSQFTIELKQPNGLYLYRVMDENGAFIGNGKFVINK